MGARYRHAVADTPTTPSVQPADAQPVPLEVDLDAVERDLTAVEVALGRLADGTYWTDEVTSQSISEQVLVDDPLSRRA